MKPEDIARLIETEVNAIEVPPQCSLRTYRELLAMRFLREVMKQLGLTDLREVTDYLITFETFDQPIEPSPSFDDAEAAAESLLDFAQNLYDEFRQPE